MTPGYVSDFVRKKITFWSFVCMVILVYIHGYNLDVRFLHPWAGLGDKLTCTSFIEYFICNSIFRFRVPMLFVISGYLYAVADIKGYRYQIFKRVKTLVIPYLFWSTFFMLISYVFIKFSYSRNYILRSNIISAEDVDIIMHVTPVWKFIELWLTAKLGYQLWFIRTLFVYDLLYPVILFFIEKALIKYCYFFCVALLWINSFSLGWIAWDGLLFFSVGVFLYKTDYDIGRVRKWQNPFFWAVFLVVFSLIKTWLAFKGVEMFGGIEAADRILMKLHYIIVISGLLTAWFGLDACVIWCMNKKWFVKSSAHSFPIYIMHAPLIAFCIDPMLSIFGHNRWARGLSFILLPTIIITIVFLISSITSNLLPKTYALIMGGRGVKQQKNDSRTV